MSEPPRERQKSEQERNQVHGVIMAPFHARANTAPLSWLKTVGFGFLLLATKRKRKQNKTHHSRISPQAQPVPAPTTPVQPRSLAQGGQLPSASLLTMIHIHPPSATFSRNPATYGKLGLTAFCRGCQQPGKCLCSITGTCALHR